MSTVFKGENSTISLVEENNGWGKPPTNYAGGRFFQNNDGTFNATRNALQSEARTPNSELSGVRLGNRNVSGSFPVEIDPENYNQILESVFYGRFTNDQVEQVVTGATLTSGAKFELEIPMLQAEITNLGCKVGDLVMIKDFSNADLEPLTGAVPVIAVGTTSITVYCPDQLEDSLNATSNVTVETIDVLRPAKTVRSFNAEETLYSEDGATAARFMTAGVVASSAAFDMPSDNTVKCTFSMLGSNKIAGSQYTKFDPTLVDGSAAHTSPVAHKKYDPLVLQDGKMISGESNTLCQLISGDITIENGTEVHFVGCSFDAAGAVSGKLTVNLNYEALFQSDADYVAFDSEKSKRVFLRLKDRNTNKCLAIYLPSVTTTAYNVNNSQGLVTASITASAVIDAEAINSIIIGSYTNNV